jgi:hypothetical protein
MNIFESRRRSQCTAKAFETKALSGSLRDACRCARARQWRTPPQGQGLELLGISLEDVLIFNIILI